MKMKLSTAWLIMFPLVFLTILGATAWANHISQSEHAEVLQRIAEINALPETRYVTLAENGEQRYTLCSGGGWCVTDGIPPKSNTANLKENNQAIGKGVIDSAAILQAVNASRKAQGKTSLTLE